jgi:hypothetical protein
MMKKLVVTHSDTESSYIDIDKEFKSIFNMGIDAIAKDKKKREEYAKLPVEDVKGENIAYESAIKRDIGENKIMTARVFYILFQGMEAEALKLKPEEILQKYIQISEANWSQAYSFHPIDITDQEGNDGCTSAHNLFHALQTYITQRLDNKEYSEALNKLKGDEKKKADYALKTGGDGKGVRLHYSELGREAIFYAQNFPAFIALSSLNLQKDEKEKAKEPIIQFRTALIKNYNKPEAMGKAFYQLEKVLSTIKDQDGLNKLKAEIIKMDPKGKIDNSYEIEKIKGICEDIDIELQQQKIQKKEYKIGSGDSSQIIIVSRANNGDLKIKGNLALNFNRKVVVVFFLAVKKMRFL